MLTRFLFFSFRTVPGIGLNRGGRYPLRPIRTMAAPQALSELWHSDFRAGQNVKCVCNNYGWLRCKWLISARMAEINHSANRNFCSPPAFKWVDAPD
jgi:hypothetical protein